MNEIFKKDKNTRLILIFFVLFTSWWLMMQVFGINKENINYHLFTVTYGIMALLGGVFGLNIAKKWGWLRSIMGKAIFMFSFGLLSQEFGQLAYTYFIYVRQIEIPYPSIGDVGYFGSIIFYILGILYLAKASGVIFSLKSVESKIQAIIFPVIILGYSYFTFLKEYQLDWSQPVKTLLDFGYPLGQAFYISLALLTLLLTKKILGGLMKPKIIFFLIALLIQYLADFNFLFQTSRGTWIYSGYGDYLYFLAYFIMTLALIQLRTAFYQIKKL